MSRTARYSKLSQAWRGPPRRAVTPGASSFTGGLPKSVSVLTAPQRTISLEGVFWFPAAGEEAACRWVGGGGAGLGHGRQRAAWWLIDGLRQPAIILTRAWVPQFRNNPCLCQGGRRMGSADWGWRGKGTGVQPGLLLPS